MRWILKIYHVLVLWTVLAYATSNSENSPETGEISLTLRSKWQATPFALQLLESVAGIREELYFPSLFHLFAAAEDDGETDDLDPEDQEKLSDSELYNRLVTYLQSGPNPALSSQDISFLNYSLQLHYYTPRVQAHFQHYSANVFPAHQKLLEQHTAHDSNSLGRPEDRNSGSFVLFEGRVYRTPDDLFALQSYSEGEAAQFADAVGFDRIYGSNNNAPVAQLYSSDVQTPQFSSFLTNLKMFADNGNIRFCLRYVFPEDSKGSDTLQGYGVELNLKRTDYLVIDDTDMTSEAQVDVAGTQIQGISAEAMGTLDLRAVSYALSQKTPEQQFRKLIEVSEYFPLVLKNISAVPVNSESESSAAYNRVSGTAAMLPTENGIFLNGQLVPSLKDNVFSVFDLLQSERNTISRLTDLGMSVSKAKTVLTDPRVNRIFSSESLRPRYDVFGSPHSRAMVRLNDVETDKPYKNWPESRSVLLESNEGHLPEIREKFLSYLFVIDIADFDGAAAASECLRMLFQGRVPAEMAMMPLLTEKDVSEMSERARRTLNWFYLSHYYSKRAGIAYLTAQTELDIPADELQFALFGKVDDAPSYEEFANGKGKLLLEACVRWCEQFAVESPEIAADGVFYPLDDYWMYNLGRQSHADWKHIARLLESNEIPGERSSGDENLRQILFRNALPMRNKLVVPSVEALKVYTTVDSYTGTQVVYEVLGNDEEPSDVPVYLTVHVIADFSDTKAVAKLAETVAALKEQTALGQNVRLVIPATRKASPFFAALYDKFASEGTEDSWEPLLQFLNSPADSFDVEDRNFIPPVYSNVPRSAFYTLVVNSRVVSLDTADVSFGQAEHAFLFEYETKGRIAPLASLLAEISESSLSDLEDPFAVTEQFIEVLTVAFIDPPGEVFITGDHTRTRFNSDKTEGLAIPVVTSTANSPVDIVAVVNPATEKGQEYLHLVQSLQHLEGVALTVLLNPRPGVQTEEPVRISRLYKALYPQEEINLNSEDQNVGVVFPDVPKNTLFSLGVNALPQWVVMPEESNADLDNILLSTVASAEGKPAVHAVYELKHLLLEGYAQDRDTGGHPVGLAVELASVSGDYVLADTIVMANLGYLQLKTQPGVFRFRLQDGPSRETYALLGVHGEAEESVSTASDDGTLLTIQDMKGTVLLPIVAKKPGMEEVELINSDELKVGDKKSSIFGSLASKLKNGLSKKSPQKADINIFTVASGHLYERFLGIMAASVMRHTNHTVKFWLIENFLSPKFKAFLPHLAEKYGFQYELVTYNWPHWLRGQREKQRTIWGYKILFLDTLFPQDLDRVIFVDADQIVRTDLIELVNMDLHGAPYGYTPMGDSREEMEGFRFWKQGYWKTLLYDNGLKYHISALYVVDLKRFREMGAGDIIRSHYQKLSADPNSLSNLDQDLPNNLQHVIPIFSLPDEWLWCETWCSDESLAQAKTIDLCNNPLTKEPKLERARRQIKEWVEYDEEIEKLAAEVRSGTSETETETIQSDNSHDEL